MSIPIWKNHRWPPSGQRRHRSYNPTPAYPHHWSVPHRARTHVGVGLLQWPYSGVPLDRRRHCRAPLSAQSCAMVVIPHRPRLHATTLRRVGVADAVVHRSNRSPRQIGTERQLSSTHPNFRSLEPRAPTPTVVTATTRLRVQGWKQARGCSGSRAKRHPGRSAN